MSEAHRKRGPRFWGFCLGAGWVILMTLVFGFMVSGYHEIFGIVGALVAVALAPLSAPAYPLVSWYYIGTFPWLWIVGLLLSYYLGRIIMGE